MTTNKMKKLLAIIAIGAMPFGTASSCDYDGAIGQFLYSDDVYGFYPDSGVYYDDCYYDCYDDDYYYEDSYYYEDEYYYDDCNVWDGCYWEGMW